MTVCGYFTHLHFHYQKSCRWQRQAFDTKTYLPLPVHVLFDDIPKEILQTVRWHNFRCHYHCKLEHCSYWNITEALISCLKRTGQLSLESGFVVVETHLFFKNFARSKMTGVKSECWSSAIDKAFFVTSYPACACPLKVNKA